MLMQIYDAYPKHVGRAAALKAIEKQTLSSIPPERLLERTQAYAQAIAGWPREDRQFIPHPATWFNRGSFDDDPSTWLRTGPTPPPVRKLTAEEIRAIDEKNLKRFALSS